MEQRKGNEMIEMLKRVPMLFVLPDARGEERAVRLFDYLLDSVYADDGLRRLFGRSDIVCVEGEVNLDGKRVDRLLRFSDGSIVLVEIKDRQDARGVVAGIGQALLYVAIAERLWPSAPEIRAALVVWGERDADVARACSRAGVVYWPLVNGPAFIGGILELADALVEWEGSKRAAA